jgi:acyl dehydratase
MPRAASDPRVAAARADAARADARASDAAPADAAPPDAAPADAAPPDAASDALVRVGERFGRELRWSAAEIRRFAESVGDGNPMHYDAAYAATTPIGGLIASGTQTTSAMMGAFATWFTRRDDGVARDALGMGFTFRLRAPVRADEPVRVAWEVVAREWKPRHRGWVVTARGSATTPAGVALEAEGTGLVRHAP